MSQRIFVVTGANKGIGYAIVKGLSQQLSDAIIYLTARNPSLGEAALKSLSASNVRFHQLDITDDASCKTFAEYLRSKHGGLDVLVNNAGFAFHHAATESAGVQADVTIGVNYYGTRLVCDHWIVTVCSQMGIMDVYKKELVDKFENPNYTMADIDKFVEDYKKLAHEDRRKEGGYPESAYRTSKAAEIALTMLQAREMKSKGITCCPGYVDTDMTSHKGHLKPEQGAETPIWLATAPEVPHGAFVYKKKPVEWLSKGKIDFS